MNNSFFRNTQKNPVKISDRNWWKKKWMIINSGENRKQKEELEKKTKKKSTHNIAAVES